MLIAWKYRERDTIIQRLDPRARIIFMLALLFSIIQFWDLRITLGFLTLALVQYFLAKLTWRETRRSWLLISILIVFMTVLTFLTGGIAGLWGFIEGILCLASGQWRDVDGLPLRE